MALGNVSPGSGRWPPTTRPWDLKAPPSALPSPPLRTRPPWLGPQRLSSLREDSMPWRPHLGNEETDRSDILRSPSSGVPDGTSVGESLKQNVLVHSPPLPEGGGREHSAELPSSRPSSPCPSRPRPPRLHLTARLTLQRSQIHQRRPFHGLPPPETPFLSCFLVSSGSSSKTQPQGPLLWEGLLLLPCQAASLRLLWPLPARRLAMVREAEGTKQAGSRAGTGWPHLGEERATGPRRESCLEILPE